MIAFVVLFAVGFEAIAFFEIAQLRVLSPTIVKMAVFLSALAFGLLLNRSWWVAKLPRISSVKWLMALCVLLAVYNVLFSYGDDYGTYKTIQFFIRSVLPVAALSVLGPYQKPEAKVILVVVVLSAVFAALLLPAYGDVTMWRGGGYDREKGMISAITVPRVVGAGVVLLLGGVVWTAARRIGTVDRGTLSGRIVQGLIAIALIGGMAFSGTRGPVVAVLVSVIACGVAVSGIQRLHVFVLSLVICCLLFFAVVAFLPEGYWTLPGVERIRGSIADALVVDDTTYGRPFLLRRALYEFVSTVGIGVGPGGFGGELEDAFGSRLYPHNILFEVGAELGIAGVIVLGGLLLCVIRDTRRVVGELFVDRDVLVVSMCWTFFLLCALVSGDLVTNDGVFVGAVLPGLFSVSSDVDASFQDLVRGRR